MKKFVDIPRAVCEHTIGKEHTTGHRMVAGSVVMAVGVTIAHAAGGVELVVLKYALDVVGYGVHGIGLIPFIDWLMENKE